MVWPVRFACVPRVSFTVEGKELVRYNTVDEIERFGEA